LSQPGRSIRRSMPGSLHGPAESGGRDAGAHRLGGGTAPCHARGRWAIHFPMSRNRPRDSSRPAQRLPARKIDTPVLVVAALTAFFATLFATLLLLRPEPTDLGEPVAADSHSTQTTPPVDAPPPEPILRTEPKPEPMLNPTPQTRLELTLPPSLTAAVPPANCPSTVLEVPHSPSIAEHPDLSRKRAGGRVTLV
jgi:hypothetical protein